MNISPMVLKTTKIGSKYGQILNKPSKCQILLKFCTKWQNFAKSGHTDRCNMRRLLVVIQTGDTGLQTELSATLPLHWIEAKYNGKKIQLSIWEGERARERERKTKREKFICCKNIWLLWELKVNWTFEEIRWLTCTHNRL